MKIGEITSNRRDQIKMRKENVRFKNVLLKFDADDQDVSVNIVYDGEYCGYAVFDRDGNNLTATDVAIDDTYRRMGIGKFIYDYLRDKGFTIHRSGDQLSAGKNFWDKHQGNGNVWA